MRTLGFIALALLQVQGDMTDGTMGSGVLDLVSRSGLLSRFVLLILFLFSVTSWAIVLRKVLHFRLVKTESERFRAVFRRSRKFSEEIG